MTDANLSLRHTRMLYKSKRKSLVEREDNVSDETNHFLKSREYVQSLSLHGVQQKYKIFR